MTAYLGLGSNLGNPIENILSAKKLIQQNDKIKFLNTSSFYKTSPMGYVNQPDFINAVSEIETKLTVTELFKFIKQTEKEMGRKKTERNGPRIIDIDILFYDDLIYQDLSITVPHIGVQNRSFVLYPICEIAPDFLHPVIRKTMCWLKEELTENFGIVKIEQ